MIKLYLYNKTTKLFVKEEVGRENYITRDIPPYCDFTLTSPPDSRRKWRWIDTKWVELLPINNPDTPYNDVSVWDDELEQWVVDHELQATKKLRDQELAWEGIKAERFQQTTGGVLVKSVNKVFHTDETSAIQYSSVAGMIALDNYEPIMWKVMDNTWVSLTSGLFRELQVSIRANTQQTYMIAEQHKAAMLESENPLEYDYQSGWLNGVVDYA